MSRSHCFTANVDNYIPVDDLKVRCIAIQQDPGFHYLVFQEEEVGHKHYQGYICWGEPKRFNAAKTILSALFNVQVHLEKARGNATSNRDYCTKQGGTNLQEFGSIPKGQGSREDLHKVAQAIIDGKSLQVIATLHPIEMIKFHRGIQVYQNLLFSKPRDTLVPPTVYWLYGPTGVGKSRRVYETYGPQAYYKMNNQWWDGYTGQEVVILDDYRPNLCTFQELLRILDRYPMRVQLKGSSTELSATSFVVTTTDRPEVMWHGRTEEALEQLLRRITHIEEIQMNHTIIHKSPEIPYIRLTREELDFKFPKDDGAFTNTFRTR